MTHVEQGPVVTRYELLPAAGVKVERIGALSNNITLALKAESIRVQAPIPGKGVVGIEVPNRNAALVVLRQTARERGVGDVQGGAAAGAGPGRGRACADGGPGGAAAHADRGGDGPGQDGLHEFHPGGAADRRARRTNCA